MTTVADLLNTLEDLVETWGEDWAESTDITIAYQPSYPLESDVDGTVGVADDGSVAEAEEPDRIVICTVQGDRGYGSKEWFHEAG